MKIELRFIRGSIFLPLLHKGTRRRVHILFEYTAKILIVAKSIRLGDLVDAIFA